jgi:alpha/beta superfamily hydrolase
MNKRLPNCLGLVLLFLTVCFGRTEDQGAGPLKVTNITASLAGLRLDWTSAGLGLDYTVQSRDALGEEGLWVMPFGNQPWPIPFTQWTDVRSPVERARFYRVLAVPASERGKVLSVAAPVTYTRDLIDAIFAGAGIPITSQYDVLGYEVVYETINPKGGRAIASGTLLVPNGTSNTLALASYQHGTITRTNDAPGQELLAGVAFATTGYAAVVPNFLGLGQISEGLHPYHHARSEATACVDMLRAARSLCATNGHPLNGQLFLAGYSQGGHVTMALLRELEAFHTNEFTVTACAPMAGAYDLSGVTLADFLSNRVQPNPYYFPLLLAAYQSVYQLAPTLADLLAPPYNATLPPLLQGNSSGSEINAAMPAVPTRILKPEYLAAFQASANHPFRLALRDNDLYRWKPRAPLRMYHCLGDQDVIFANSQVAFDNFQNLGATQVRLIDPLPTGDHGECVMPSLLDAKAWFDSLRQ